MSKVIVIDPNGGASLSRTPRERWGLTLRALSNLARDVELDPATVQVVGKAGNHLTVEFPGIKVLRSKFLAQAEHLLNQPGFIDEFNHALGDGTRLYLPADPGSKSKPTVF